MNTTPIYHQTAAYAREHGELEAYRASTSANIACKEAIEASIRTHFDGMRLEKTAASEVIAAFGMERVAYVLANTVQQKSWDGRFSQQNKAWANQYEIAGAGNPDHDRRYQFVVESHPAVLDGFIHQVRNEIAQERTSEPPKPSMNEAIAQARAQIKPSTRADMPKRSVLER